MDIVKPMVERTQVELEARDEYDKTPLHFAAYSGKLSVVQYMCEQGGDKEARSGNDNTLLHYAAEKGHHPVVQYFEGLK